MQSKGDDLGDAARISRATSSVSTWRREYICMRLGRSDGGFDIEDAVDKRAATYASRQLHEVTAIWQIAYRFSLTVRERRGASTSRIRVTEASSYWRMHWYRLVGTCRSSLNKSAWQTLLVDCFNVPVCNVAGTGPRLPEVHINSNQRVV